MPTYEYMCDDCGNNYEEFRFMYEEAPKKCNKCGKSKHFHQVYDGGRQVCRTDEPKTVGQLGEKNYKELQNNPEEFEKVFHKKRNKVLQVPKTASIVEVEDGPPPPWRDGTMGPKLDKPLDLSKVKDLNKYVETGTT